MNMKKEELDTLIDDCAFALFLGGMMTLAVVLLWVIEFRPCW